MAKSFSAPAGEGSADARWLASLLASERFRYADEAGLQAAIGDALSRRGVGFAREVALSPLSRIDFLVGAVGLEVKVGSSLAEVERQLWRYSEEPAVAELLLATTRSAHRRLPESMNGKPVSVAYLLGSIF